MEHCVGDAHRKFSFADKARIFSSDYLKCAFYIVENNLPDGLFTTKLYSKLISTSQVLEDFLDFHGAKNSADWYLYREASAAVRHLSLGAYCQKHILNRLCFYDIPDTPAFRAEGEKTISFLNNTLRNMAPVILSEAARLNITMPEERFTDANFPGIVTGEMLSYDIDDDAKDVQKRQVVNIASEFLDIARQFDRLAFYEPRTYAEMKAMVPDKVDEVKVCHFEMMVHNLQSSFDTYVSPVGFHFGDRRLKSLRSYFSVVFHLLQMMGRLFHFYERHLREAGYKSTYKRVQEQLIQRVNPEELLDRTINYGLYYTCHYLQTGKKLAMEILNENIERGSITVGIPVKLGFHSRPSLLVAKIVQHFGGQVELVVGKDRFDASSVLDIQWAGGKIQKEQITEVVFEGDTRALDDIKILASVNYGEDIMGKGVPLPSELSYLK